MPSSDRGTRTFVLDTSVLLSDPFALLRFAEHEVVLPVVVVTELEAKRHHPELGWFARRALRLLDGAPIDIHAGGATVASTNRSRLATPAALCEWSSTTATPRCCRPGSGCPASRSSTARGWRS